MKNPRFRKVKRWFDRDEHFECRKCGAKDDNIDWDDHRRKLYCKECGYVHYGNEPPDVCPSCDHSKAYYELKCEEF